MSSNAVILKDIDSIVNQLENVSSTMVDYIKNHHSSKFTLYFKTINHSDLSNKGKRCGPNESVDKNYLYYQSNEEMHKLFDAGIRFETAKQSNMGIPSEIFTDLNIPREPSVELPIKLVNDSATYFKEYYTIKILKALGKECKWEGASIYPIEYGDFTSFNVTYGNHGIGTSRDEFFSKLRLSIFLGDTVYFLIENKKYQKVLYLLLKKDERFFNLLNKDTETDNETDNGNESIVSEDDMFYSLTSSSKTKLNGLEGKGILVGCYKSINHLKWIIKQKKYNIRSGNRKGAISESVDMLHFLILYHINNHNKYGIYEILNYNEVSKQDMIDLEYPSTNPASRYVVFDIKEYKSANDVNINIDSIIKLVKEKYPDYINGTPIIIK